MELFGLYLKHLHRIQFVKRSAARSVFVVVEKSPTVRSGQDVELTVDRKTIVMGDVDDFGNIVSDTIWTCVSML